MFANILHDVELLILLLMRSITRDIVFGFWTPELRAKAVNVDELNVVKLSTPAVQIFTS